MKRIILVQTALLSRQNANLHICNTQFDFFSLIIIFFIYILSLQ